VGVIPTQTDGGQQQQARAKETVDVGVNASFDKENRAPVYNFYGGINYCWCTWHRSYAQIMLRRRRLSHHSSNGACSAQCSVGAVVDLYYSARSRQRTGAAYLLARQPVLVAPLINQYAVPPLNAYTMPWDTEVAPWQFQDYPGAGYNGHG